MRMSADANPLRFRVKKQPQMEWQRYNGWCQCSSVWSSRPRVCDIIMPCDENGNDKKWPKNFTPTTDFPPRIKYKSGHDISATAYKQTNNCSTNFTPGLLSPTSEYSTFLSPWKWHETYEKISYSCFVSVERANIPIQGEHALSHVKRKKHQSLYNKQSVALQPWQAQAAANTVPQPKLMRMRSRWLAYCPNTRIRIILIQQPEPSGSEAGEYHGWETGFGKFCRQSISLMLCSL
jgi:hypothetical protein